MSSRLNSNPTHVNQSGYNPFTLHQTVDRTDTAGYITPCYYAKLVPGDFIDMMCSARSRTLPLLAPASASLHQCIDVFFVPLNQILQQIGGWIDNIRDEKSDFYASLTTDNSPQNLPCFNPMALFKSFADDVAQDLYGNQDQSFQPYNEFCRLADSLHIPIADYIRLWNISQGGQRNPFENTANLAVFHAAAYQKIYFDYYRLSDREKNDPSYYNFDTYMQAKSSPASVNSIALDRARKLFKIHRVPYRKDFFTNLFISPIQGQKDLSSYGINPAQVQQWLTGLTSLTSGVPVASTPIYNGGNLQESTTNPTSNFMFHRQSSDVANFTTVRNALSMVNPANISAMFAVQKMLEISRRAGKHFDAQTLAHYGINVPTGISGEVMHLGHYEQPFIIGDVISTAGTDATPLGEMAGKGYSTGTMKFPIKFKAPYHGILMAVHYIVPDVVYSQHGLDREQMYITPADWPRPELDSLGMQPLFGYQVTQYQDFNSDVYGWQWRYAELKQKYNIAYGGVHSDGSLHYWALTRYPYTYNNALDSFLVPADYLNDIMVPQFDSGFKPGESKTDSDSGFTYGHLYYNAIYENDPIVTHISFNVRKSSRMSTYGLMPL